MISSLKEFIEDQDKAMHLEKMQFDGNFIYDILPQHLELMEVNLNEKEISKYRFNPKRLSYDVYKTTDYWFLILVSNGYKHIHEFNLDGTIKLPTGKSISNCISLQALYGENYES